MENSDTTKKPSARELLKQTNTKIKNQSSLDGLNSSEIARFIGQYKATISQVLPRHMTVERVLQVAVNLVNKNNNLKKCNAQSIISSIIQSSELGFNPVQALGQCYFVPYNVNVGDRNSPKWESHVQMQIGYKGYIELARRSGLIKSLFAYCVYEGDEFSYELGLNPDLTHRPSENVDKKHEDITHVYAVAHYKDGGSSFVVLTKNEVEKLRKRNRSQNEKPSQAWATDYDKMAMAKAIKQLSRWMPLSDEMQKAIVVDESIPQLNQFTNEGADLDKVVYDIPHEEIEE